VKRYILTALLVSLAVATNASIAYATTGAAFFNEAAKWSYANCRTVSTTSRINNTICHLLDTSRDNAIVDALQNFTNTSQQNSIDDLTARASIPGPKGDKGDTGDAGSKGDKGDTGEQGPAAVSKMLKVVIQGNEYGPVVNEQLPTFFYEPIQRFVVVGHYGTIGLSKMALGQGVDLEYESADCTGSPYIAYFDDGQYRDKIWNNLLTAGFNSRYIVERSVAPLTITRGSTQGYNYNTETPTCSDGGGIQKEVVPVTPVNIPITDPLNYPFEYKYK